MHQVKTVPSVSATIRTSTGRGVEEIILRAHSNDRAASVEFLQRLCPALQALQQAAGEAHGR